MCYMVLTHLLLCLLRSPERNKRSTFLIAVNVASLQNLGTKFLLRLFTELPDLCTYSLHASVLLQCNKL